MRYQNPVYPEYFADPFVWKHDGVYYAVGTGVVEAHSDVGHSAAALTIDGEAGVFLILRSNHLASWTPVGSALKVLHPDYGDAYWAPEVAFAGGRFYLYYSVGRGFQALARLHAQNGATEQHPRIELVRREPERDVVDRFQAGAGMTVRLVAGEVEIDFEESVRAELGGHEIDHAGVGCADRGDACLVERRSGCRTARIRGAIARFSARAGSSVRNPIAQTDGPCSRKCRPPQNWDPRSGSG